MKTRGLMGEYVTQRIGGEVVRAYVPAKLPPEPALVLDGLYPQLDKAMQVVGALGSVISSIPNTALFIYMYVRKEALLSSQIEGTQSSFSDLILFEHELKTDVLTEDVEEVSNYVAAMQHGLRRLREGFPMSLRLMREIHAILLSGGRGAHQCPGEFRRSQNWVGGTRPGNALYVPPAPERLMEVLGDFEKFLHSDTVKLPILVKAALAHLQFETIHPFLDGNGRLGRLLITLMLCEGGVLEEPVLYLSLYLKQNRALYYELLQQVRLHGTWETWIEFFLDGVYQTAQQAVATAKKMNALFASDLEKIYELGRAKFSCIDVFEYLKKLPQVSVPLLAHDLNISAPTARTALTHLCELGIVEEVSGKMRDKVYVYRKYLSILEDGAQPL